MGQTRTTINNRNGDKGSRLANPASFRKKNLAAIFVLFLLSSYSFSSELSGRAQADLAHIYTNVKANHPGYVDKQNPEFMEWLEEGYRLGLEAIETVQTERDHISVVKTYVAGFADGHFTLHVNDDLRTWRWAGIVMHRSAGEYRVRRAEDGWASAMPPVGATLLECDGRAAETVMREEVLRYQFNEVALEFPKARYAPWIFIDDGLARRHFAQECIFRIDQRLQRYPIVWREVDSSPLPEPVISVEFGIEVFDTAAYWVRIPTFKPDPQTRYKLEGVIADLARLRDARVIVFDVRGNTGGNSSWALELVGSVYPQPVINDYLESHFGGRAMWRVSADNLRYLEAILPDLAAQFGRESEVTQEISDLAIRMRDALERGEELVAQSNKAEAATSTDIQPPSPKARIILITDADCGSACLDFADRLLNLPDVTHLGQETGADTVYMDIRSVDLPSGIGRFSLAQKVYRDRPRLHNQSYIPAHVFPGSMEDTDALMRWVKGQIR